MHSLCLSFFSLPCSFPMCFSSALWLYTQICSPCPSSCLPPSVPYCLSVLFFCYWELISGPSAVIQLSHSLLSPIHSTPLCPSPCHRLATLLLMTTLLSFTTLSGFLRPDWYNKREIPNTLLVYLDTVFLLFFSTSLLVSSHRHQPAHLSRQLNILHFL